MGFLTDGERDSLRIETMILHVVGEDPFVPEPATGVEHSPFFLERIKGTDVAAVYSFTAHSDTRTALERMARDEVTFEVGAQDLSREFSRWHGTTAKDGAFFIFDLRVDDPGTRIYSLIKYDYQEALEQTTGNRRRRLRRIIHALVGDKKAIQKSALVRVVNGHSTIETSTHDRAKPSVEIADYFASFLDVERTRSDRELCEVVRDVVRKTLHEAKETLPNQDVPEAFRRAIGTLRDRQQIDEDAITDAILAAAGNPENDDDREQLIRKATQKIRSAKLSGLTFRPVLQVFRKPSTRKLRTTEGIVLLYPDESSSVRVEAVAGGGARITITTDRILEDGLVRDTAG